MPRDDQKLTELKQVAVELDRRAQRLEIDEGQIRASLYDLDAQLRDIAIQRQIIADQRVNYERVVRIYSDERAAQVTRG